MQLCTVIQESVAIAISAKLHVPQVKNTCNDLKQVLHRKKSLIHWLIVTIQTSKEGQWPTYFGINLINIDDLQSISDCFPVIFVIDGGHDSTLSLSQRVNYAYEVHL